MQRTFVPWWILLLTAGLFAGFALASALEEKWLGVLIGLPLAAFSVRVALVHRSRLQQLENSDHPLARKH